jgi:hypothetical protein
MSLAHRHAFFLALLMFVLSSLLLAHFLFSFKVEALYGVTRTREVYQKAIEVLPDEGAKNMCIQFAELERKLGEVRYLPFPAPSFQQFVASSSPSSLFVVVSFHFFLPIADRPSACCLYTWRQLCGSTP